MESVLIQSGIAESVLGLAMKAPENIETIAEIVKTPAVFDTLEHRTIYGAMLTLFQDGIGLDLITVSRQLQSTGDIQKIGGSAYLDQMIANVVSNAQLSKHCQMLVEAYRLRTLQSRLAALSGRCSVPDITADEIIQATSKTLDDVSDAVQFPIVRVSDVAQDTIDRMLRDGPDSSRWIETRIADLNAKITGFFKGDMVIVGGPPSMGKTSLAIDAAIFATAMGKSVLYVSIDQTMDSLIMRLLTNLSGVSRTTMFKKNFTATEEMHIAKYGAQLANLSTLHLCDKAGLTVLDIRTLVSRVKRQYGLDMVIVDYLQQIVPHRRFENRNLELQEISRVLKQVAKESDIAMVALSQLNRTRLDIPIHPEKGQWGFPDMSMLRDSGALEQDANLILFPWVPKEVCKKKYGENSQTYIDISRMVDGFDRLAYIVIAKQKDGETGVVRCVRDDVRMRFYSEDRVHG